jgi:hypothetical protein
MQKMNQPATPVRSFHVSEYVAIKEDQWQFIQIRKLEINPANVKASFPSILFITSPAMPGVGHMRATNQIACPDCIPCLKQPPLLPLSVVRYW